MWEFLSSLLEMGGVVAALYGLTLIGIAIAGRVIWNSYGKVLTQLATVQTDQEKKRGELRLAFEVERRELREQHAAELARLRGEHAAELLAVADQRRVEADRFGARLDAVRDHHTAQMVGLVEKSTRHIERIDQTVGKLSAGLDVLIRFGEGSGR